VWRQISQPKGEDEQENGENYKLKASKFVLLY